MKTVVIEFADDREAENFFTALSQVEDGTRSDVAYFKATENEITSVEEYYELHSAKVCSLYDGSPGITTPAKTSVA